MIGIFGAGVVGARFAESLSIESQTSILVYDSSQIVAQRLARRLSETNSLIKATNRSELNRAKVIVLAGPMTLPTV
jgi:Trk K+ transport system NAD-binding subunit